MKYKLEKCLSRIATLFFLLISFSSFAQDGTLVANIDSTDTRFDYDLIPAMSIYGTSWDSAHVDSPYFDKKKVAFGYNLALVDEDCDYYHPFNGVITSNFGWRRGRMHKGVYLGCFRAKRLQRYRC